MQIDPISDCTLYSGFIVQFARNTHARARILLRGLKLAAVSIQCAILEILQLERPVNWNPATLRFIDNEEAANHRLTHYQYRNPYKL